MDKIFKGEELEKERVREWDPNSSGEEGGKGQKMILFDST
jgi:hypothetical protein